MSSDHIKTPGPLSDFLNSQTFKDNSKINSEHLDNHLSGWEHFPEGSDEQDSDNNSLIGERAEAILKKLITENTEPHTSDNEKILSDHKDFPSTTLLSEAEEINETNITDLIEKVNRQAAVEPPPLPVEPIQKKPEEQFYPEQYVEQQDIMPQPVEFTGLPAQSSHDNQEAISKSEDDQLRVDALERWLAKPVPNKENSPALTAIFYTLGCIALVMLTYTGIYLTGNYKSFDAPLKQMTSLIAGSAVIAKNTETKVNTSSNSSNIILTSNANGSEKNSSTFSKKGSGSDNYETPKTKVIATAALSVIPAQNPIAENCPLPSPHLTALPGGFTAIKINSACRNEQTVDINYAGISFKTRFDQRGNLSFILDCFVGDREEIQISYEDGKKQLKKPVLSDMNSLSKITVIWNSEHDLNLHAFEYASPENSTGHIWEKHPLSLESATKKIETNGSGHGFMSSTSGMSKGITKKIEVYTFVHSSIEIERPGVIKLALEYLTPSSKTKQVTCTDANASYLSYETIQIHRNEKIKKENGQIITNNCSQTARLKKLMPHAIQDLHVGG